MTNVEIKKTIQKYTKGITDYRIELILWHGEVCTISDDFDRGIYNEVIIFDKDEKLIDTDKDAMYFGNDMLDTDENVKILLKEQNKVYKYLKGHFQNVTKCEMNI